MKTSKRILSLMLCCMMFINYMPAMAFADNNAGGTPNAGTGTEAPAANKTLEPNGDGTYDLSLSVTGTASTETETSTADVIIVFDKSYSMTYSAGRGKTRMSVAKPAVKNLIDSLLAKNQKTAGAVKVGLVSFGSTATVDSQLSDNSTSLKNIVENYNTNAPSGDRYNYTNWEDALQKVQAIETRSGAKKYVIFVSDGNPTVYVGGGAKNETDSNVNNCFNHAKDDAQALAKKGYKFYGVGAFGDATRMQNLVKEAGGTGDLNDDYFDASDEAALIAAFANIIESITTTIDYEKVKITDGVTGLTSMMEIDGKPGNFTYTRTDGQGNTKPWDKAPAASFNEDTRNVTWDLSTVDGKSFALEDGVTYTVHFTVWPSQRAYDITAAWDDGLIKYGDTTTKLPDGTTVTSDEWAQFDKDSKALKTNTEAKVDYTAIKNVNGTRTEIGHGPAGIENPDPVPLASAKMHVVKEWADDLSSADRPDKVELVILQDGKEFETVTLTAENGWKTDITIAPGILATIKEKEGAKGHEYTLKEPGIDNHYELTNVAIKPMVYDNNQNLEDMDDPEVDEEGHTTYHKWDDGDALLTATNTVKGGIEIRKTVYKDATTKDTADRTKFKFTIDLTDAKGNKVSSPDRDKPVSGDLGYRIYSADGTETDRGAIKNGTATLTIDQTQYIRIVNVPNGTNYNVTESPASGFNIKSKTGDNGTVSGNKSSAVAFENVKDYDKDVVNPVSVTINKIDANTKNAIEMTENNKAVFTVYSDADCKTEVGTTELKNGMLTFEFEAEGTYYIKETKAPTGYSLNAEVKTVKVSKVAADPAERQDPQTRKWVKVYNLETNIKNNTYTVSDTPETTVIKVKKIWEDGDNRDGKRSAFVTVNIYGNDTLVDGATLTLNNSNKWEATSKALPKYADGKKITYTIKESNVPEGYTVEQSGDVETGFTLTNKYTPEITSVKVTKVWEDDSDRDKVRPGSITVQLLANGNPVKDKTLTLNDNNQWEDTFANLPKNEAGKAITYSVQEVKVAGYESKITGDAANGFVITNTHEIEKVSIPVAKAWNDEEASKIDGYENPYGSVTVQLLANGKPVKDETLTLNARNKWADQFKDLPKNEAGKAITYTVEEVELKGYKSVITGNAADGFTVTNTPVVEVVRNDLDLTVIKLDKATKEPLAGAGFTVTKVDAATGEELDRTTADGQTGYTFKEQGTWIVEEFDAPNDYDLNDVNTYEIVVKEKVEMTFDKDAGKFKEIHTLYYDENQIDNFKDGELTVENPRTIHTLPMATFKKVWDDANNADKLRADYEVTLLANGEVANIDDAVVTLKPEEQEYKWENLPINDEFGNEIVYTIVETKVPSGYTSSTDKAPAEFVEGVATITNKHVVTPKTSDDTNIPFSAGMLLSSILGIFGVAFSRKRREA
ncbi:MAG: Cna B-type domain-containing protein [Clostridiales bacterium]|nr:Cna B-type domain-containing protein [Candidatus Crickella merdequi]